MAFETGVATSQGDFINKLTTFASNNGWTLDEFDDTTNNRAAVSQGNCFVQWKWDDSSSIAGYQSLGFSGGTAPGQQTGDSGNGDISGAIDTDRRWNAIGNGPYIKYWLFEDAAIAPYVHYVLEYAPGFFVHGSFGTIEKFGSWTGGEYHGMSLWASGAVNSSAHHALIDSAHVTTGNTATIHCEGLPSQAGAGKWGVFTRFDSSLGVDRASNGRVRFMGGPRDDYLVRALQGIRANTSNGLVPMVPLLSWYLNPLANKRFMGKFIDVVQMNGFFLVPGSAITVDAATWHVFPVHRKATSGVTSGNLFLAYRQRA